MNQVRIGILGLQGAVREHAAAVEACGGQAIIIKQKAQLKEIDGLILPGGESTTMRRLIDQYGFMNELQKVITDGLPVFGTCAGLILLAKNLVGYEEAHIAAFDVTVERNSFGRQKDSFEANIDIDTVANDFPAVFIRAPHIVSVGDDVEVLAIHEDRIVFARQGNILGCSFHPELTNDHRITDYFLRLVKENNENIYN